MSNIGNITVSGQHGSAIGLNGNGGGDGFTLVNQGSVSVSSGAGGAVGIGANSGAATSLTSTGDIYTVSAGNTFAQISHGLAVTGMENTIISTGDIVTEGRIASGILASGPVVFTNNTFTVGIPNSTSITSLGDLTIAGVSSSAILGQGEAVEISSTGEISTQGDGSSGILAARLYFYNYDTGEEAPRDFGGASAAVLNDGPITTLGNKSKGILAGADEVAIATAGPISTAGEDSAALMGLGDDISILNAGDIDTAGGLSGGIIAMRDVTVDTSGQPTFNYDATTVDVVNSGNISTAGNGSIGIGAGARLGAATVVNTGDTATLGNHSGAIYATGRSAAIASTADISTAGNAAFLGAGGAALFAHSVGGVSGIDMAEIVSAGDISTQGDPGPALPRILVGEERKRSDLARTMTRHAILIKYGRNRFGKRCLRSIGYLRRGRRRRRGA